MLKQQWFHMFMLLDLSLKNVTLKKIFLEVSRHKFQTCDIGSVVDKFSNGHINPPWTLSMNAPAKKTLLLFLLMFTLNLKNMQSWLNLYFRYFVFLLIPLHVREV